MSVEKNDYETHELSESVSSPPQSLLLHTTGWKHRRFRCGRWSLPAFASPPAQLLIVALVCFLCPGMFNALSGMGGGGQVSAYAADNANVALYSTFSVIGFFAGTFTNVLGVRFALCFGGLGYSVYIAAFLSYNHTENAGFCIFAGALLGLCAGLLWTAQGTVMMSYPEESRKGRYISWFWVIFNLGAVIGGLIPLAQNMHNSGSSKVTDGTYIGFLVLTFLGAMLAWALVSAKEVVRSDGSRIILMKNPSWRSELFGLVQTIKIDPAIILLFPMFWSSNWFYTYHFNGVNLARFDVRTRALNSTLYWAAQMFGALIFGYCLDSKHFRRTTRAKMAWAALFTLTVVIWGGGYAWQRLYDRAETTATETTPPRLEPLDWTSTGYIGPMFLYMFYGFYDAAWQTCIYWFMGAMTNNGRKLANYAGFYKGIQSAGAAVAWRLDGIGTSYMSEYASNFALLGGSLLIALPLIAVRITDHVTIEEDLRFSDENFAEVAPEPDNVVETLSEIMQSYNANVEASEGSACA